MSNSENNDETFIIEYLSNFKNFSVLPKKKQFVSSEEKEKFRNDYSKKIKTELCKNFQVLGHCKFG